jgi:transposase-like protein
MMSAAEHEIEQAAFKHPRCPVCAVPMWFMKVEHDTSGNALHDRQHFKCMACDAVAVIPPLDR